jgi:hypothetical protein
MQLKAAARPRVAMCIATNEMRELMQRGSLVVRAEEHLTRFSDHPTERMRGFTTCACMVMNAHPLKPAPGACSSPRQELKRWAPVRPGGNSEATHRANLKGEIERPLRRLGPTPSNLDAIHTAHFVSVFLPAYGRRIAAR